MDKLIKIKEYNEFFNYINQKDTKEYFKGSRFIKIIKEFDNSFPDYTQYMKYRKDKGLNESRKVYFADILNSFDEDTRVKIVARIYEVASGSSEIKTIDIEESDLAILETKEKELIEDNVLLINLNQIYNRALAIKDIARKDNNHIEQYKEASLLYKEASLLISKIILSLKSIDINKKLELQCLEKYYLYESYDCIYAYHYKNDKFSKAIIDAETAHQHIQEAIKVIDNNINVLSKEMEKKLLDLRKKYLLSNLTIQIKYFEPKYKELLNNNQYMEALDIFAEMNKIQDKVIDYIDSTDLENVYSRIQRGNAYAGKASIANILARIYIEKDTGLNYTSEILKQYIVAYTNIKLAQRG